MYLSGERFEKDATEMYVNQILFNIFNNNLLLKIYVLSPERGDDKTLMKCIDTTKS